ncbi:acetyl/propionyl/methylcrotonyl-CoA carboxylase subunit alpha [Brachybacterium saurashtrense]|uniref:biotin carboxylase n=1 Tax=Brachybacterium saurashtrense TaxID=556288 RepID=A0A345YRX2_9MICO|nr:biotin carboxylase N-terminal domain-containing protein [Brachybacterium saurashtrense]AXK46674.1 acetyl/propionyl-CoA carboxylase subunit alpha [Brachybacterium saurashtrense]RRR22388.1 acetyl/propionyl-CoA carboxylase subunit alpha [Brachybacterium saurashtrense]
MTSPSTLPAGAFDAVLIANRGEIALRILRSVHAAGLAAIAVHTDEDAASPHVRAADRAVRVDSYLDGDQILAAARTTGAGAIHPGYGFLAENAAFARACAAAGIVFVGPPAAAIETMGDKIAARAAVTARDVPVVPGLAEPGLDDAALCAAAAEIGFPLLVKPAAGGGGKGMHAVADAAALPAALAAARREAAGAFGDDTLFLERLITAPRHIEVQILADAHGHVIHLGERECSLQRRHQKVIEEAPSPSLTPAQRERFGQAAVEAARAVDYVGAGTVEFIVAGDAPEAPFFLEMNTRLQVEHAVTEAVTGIDLVAAQLAIAAGVSLSLTQEEVQLRGHAIEARIYAEDPDAGFLPTGGTLHALALPDAARVDHALAEGLAVSSRYDPMLAKVITHAPTRAQALGRLDRALAQTHLLGVVTNTAFLRALLALPEVREGRLDTGLIERRLAELARPPLPAHVLAVGALLEREAVTRSRPAGLWHATSGWRLGAPAPYRVRFEEADGTVHTIALVDTAAADGADGAVADAAARARVESGPAGAGEAAPAEEFTLCLHEGAVTIDGVRLPLRHHLSEHTLWVGLPGEDRELRRHRPRWEAGGGAAAPTLDAPMPGTVTAVLVADGDPVTAGQAVLVVEAMKMEHTLLAPEPGTVRLDVAAGQRVARGEELAWVEPAEPADGPSDSVGADAAEPVGPDAADPVGPAPTDTGPAPEEARP